MKNKLKAKN